MDKAPEPVAERRIRAPNLLKPSGARPSSAIASAGRAPEFDPALLAALRRDHREIIAKLASIQRKYVNVRQPFSQALFSSLPAELVAVRSRLEAHLLAVNVRFYNYIEYAFRDDEVGHKLVREYRREINLIARDAIEFMRKYQWDIRDVSGRDEFNRSLLYVARSLTERFWREEEHLFPVYLPHKKTMSRESVSMSSVNGGTTTQAVLDRTAGAVGRLAEIVEKIKASLRRWLG